MTDYKKRIAIRWADIDANFHLRHSVYYDFGAQVRTMLMEELGVTLSLMQREHIGPVLFREECIFKREIRFHDEIDVTVKLKKIRADFSRFTIQNEFIKSDGTLCAVLTIEGAWMDTKIRKIAPPPQAVIDAIEAYPKALDFVVEN